MDEDAEALGLSTLSGAHDVLVPRICELLRETGMGHVMVFLGGIIPERDHESMLSNGVRAIFGPGSRTDEILLFLDEASSRVDSGAPIGVVGEDGWHWN